MKQYLFIILLIFALSSCSIFSNSQKDLDEFLSNYQQAYCKIIKIWQDFVAQWPQNEVGQVPELWEVPSAAKSWLKMLEVKNVKGNIDDIEKSPLNKDFPESIRLLNLQYKYKYELLEKSSKSKDYWDFYDNVVSNTKSYSEVLSNIQVILFKEYKNIELVKEIHTNLFDPSDKNFQNFCN